MVPLYVPSGLPITAHHKLSELQNGVPKVGGLGDVIVTEEAPGGGGGGGGGGKGDTLGH